MGERDRVAELRARLADFDQAELVACVAGLDALPINAGRRLRLDVLAEVAAAAPPWSGRRRLRQKDLALITNGPELAALLPAIEDPPQFPFSERIFFEGRGYLAFGCVWAQYVGGADEVLTAYAGEAADPELGSPECRNLILSVLTLGDAMARRFDFDAGIDPGNAKFVTVPATFGRAAALATWSAAELEELLGDRRHALDALTADLGSFAAGDLPEQAAFDYKPLIRLPDGSIVVFAWSLLGALTRELLAIAERNTFLPRVQDGIAKASLRAIDEAARLIDADWKGAAPAELAFGVSPPPVMYELDVDIAMVGIPLVAPLDDARGPGEMGWDPRSSIEDFDERWPAIAEWARSTGGYREVLLVVVPVSPPYWSSFVPVPRLDPSIRTVVADPSDLLVMCYLERGEPLGLLRFARSLDALPEMMLSWSPLDAFSVYVKNRSFYMSDEAKPTAMLFAVGSGLTPRLRYIQERRPDAGELRGDRRLLLEARYKERSPIFAPRHRAGQHVRLVRLDGCDIWLLSKPFDQIDEATAHLMFDVMEAAAYWVWQVAPTVLSRSTAPPPNIVIYLDIDDEQAWQATDVPEIEPSQDDILFGADKEQAEGFVTLAIGLRSALHRADNQGERHLAFVLAEVIASIAVDDNGLNRQLAADVLTIVGPPSQRKMILLIMPGTGWQVGAADGLPRWHKLSEWHDGHLRDQLGDDLAKAGYVATPVGDRDAENKLLKDAVAIQFGHLERKVSELSPDGLIEQLMLRHETAVRERTLARLLIPTRIACFGEYSDVAADLRQEDQHATRAAVALRFLIEYVAAQPPTGKDPLTRDRYDELVALAGMISDFGRWSDVVAFELAEVGAHVLGSGRLGMRPEAIDKGLNQWLQNAFPGAINAAREAFAGNWESSSEDPGSPPAEIEAAFAAELGFSLSELGATARSLVEITFDAERNVVTLDHSELSTQIAARAGLDPTRANAVVELFSLRPRKAFLEVDPPYRREDTYPWRYGRQLSLVRRPLVITRVAEGGEAVTWGRRGVYQAYSQLVGSYLAGHAKPTSREMERLQSQRSKVAGDEFPKEVAAAAGDLGMATHLRVKRFGKSKMVDDQGDLGDIDVLGVDELTRTLWSIECKNVREARTPWELHSELTELHRPATGIVARHSRRARWLKGHLAEVTSSLGLPEKGWGLNSLIVSSAELVGPHITKSAIPIVSIDRLPEVIESARRRTRGTAARSRKKLKKKGRR